MLHVRFQRGLLPPLEFCFLPQLTVLMFAHLLLPPFYNTTHSLTLLLSEICLTQIMQTLFKNLFNSINLLGISLLVISIKIFLKPSVKGTLRYRKINFFTTSALGKYIFRVNIFLFSYIPCFTVSVFMPGYYTDRLGP